MTLSRSPSIGSKSPHDPAPATMSKSPQRKSSRPSLGSMEKCQRNSSNRLSLQSRQRRAFLKHLEQWSLNHDSSPHFQGKISLLPQGSTSREQFELGKSVHCILTDSSFTDARQKIIIRLFPPQQGSFRNTESIAQQVDRRDSMEPLSPTMENPELQAEHPGERKITRTDQPSTSSRQYKLVVRCGAGWIPAREYFSKIYFSHLEGQKASRPGPRTLDEALERRSQSLGPIPLDKDTIILRPLFHPFLRLPQEMQDLVLSTAAGISRSYNLCSDEFGTPKVKPTDSKAPISLATLFKVSKAINYHLIPHVYHSTDFEFGLTGFTNFLWQSGPTNRPEIRRLTFRLGKMALLHCLRWLAPNPVFALFEPPVATNPRSLQYFWRCQIQDLTKELHLLTLTINIALISKSDLAMVVAILRLAFGSVTRLHFVETDDKGDTKTVHRDDPRLKKLTISTTWRELCLAYFTRYRNYSYFFKFELLRYKVEDVDKLMDEDKAFFDSVAVC